MQYCEQATPEQCIEFVKDGKWSWFLTLRFRKNDNCGLTPQEAFEIWIAELGREECGGVPEDYVLVREARDDGEIQLHVLFSFTLPEKRRIYWRFRWRELTSCRTWEREIRLDTAKLFAFLVFRKNCPILCQGLLRDISWPASEWYRW